MDQTRREVAHLLRRAGFGASPSEIDAAARAGYDATVERLVRPAAADDDDARVADLDVDRGRIDGVRLVWLHRMLRTQQPLREKMVLFWHGHLTSAVSKLGGRRGPALLDQQLGLFREHASHPWLRPYEGPTRADVDATTLHGKVLCGYQGWFRCPGDETEEGWVHWSRDPHPFDVAAPG